MSNNRQERIRDLLRQASANSDKHEDEFIPRLVRREPRERPLSSRLEVLHTLTRMRGGIGRPTRKAAKVLLTEIRATAAAQNASGELASDLHQEILDRAGEIEAQLKSVKVRRETKIGKQQLTKAEQEKMLTEAKEPFPAPEGYQWFPPRRLTDGKAVWLLVAPVMFEVIDRRTFNEKIKSRSVESQPEQAG